VIRQPLLEKVMSVPATSAPVERIRSGLGLGLGLEHAGLEPIPACYYTVSQ